MNGNIEIQDYYGQKPLTPVRTAPIVMIVMAASMIGAASGLFIADRNTLLLLKKDIAAQLAAVRGYLLASADAGGAKPETPKAIPTGLSSIVALYYSSKPDSAQVAFDLEAVDLVRTGKLRGPDRIYFDLQDRNREQGTLRRLKTQNAVSIDGDLLSRVRLSQQKPGATRIVLDLRRSCDFTYQTSPGPPSRLTVEIRPHATGASTSQ